MAKFLYKLRDWPAVAGNALKFLQLKSTEDSYQWTTLDVSGTNTGDETAARIGALTNAASEATTPADTDLLGLTVSSVLKKLTWANVKATLFGAKQVYVTTEAALIAQKDFAGNVIVAAPITLTANLTTTCGLYISRGCPITVTGFVLTENGPHLSDGAYQQYVAADNEVVMAAGIVRNPYWWGNSTSALQSALKTMVASSKMVITPGVYTVDASVSVDIPSNCVIEARGAQLNFTTDAAGIDFNVSNRTEVADFRWLGGYLKNTAGTKVNSTAFEFRDFRSVEIVAYFQGFAKAIKFSDRDSLYVHHSHFYDNLWSIYLDQSAAPTSGSLLITRIEDNYFALGGETGAIYGLKQLGALRIAGNSFNGACTSTIYIDNTGATSSLRGFEIVDNHFEQGTASTTYLSLINTVGGTAPYLGVKISGNTFNDSTPDAVVLQRCVGVQFDVNTFAQTAGNGVPISLDANCSRVVIAKSNWFSTATISYACDPSAITFEDQKSIVQAALSSGALTAAQVTNTLLTNTGQGPNDRNKVLPTAAAGYEFIAAVGEAQTAKYWRFTASTSPTPDDFIFLDGTGGKTYVQIAAPTQGAALRCYTQQVASTGINASAALAIGGTTTNVYSGAFTFDIAGVGYSKTAVAAGTAPGNDVIPQSKYGAVAFDIGADGTIDAVEATDNATGYDSAALAVAGLPAAEAAHVRMGYVTATKSDGDFTFGTTALNAENATVAYTSTAAYTKPYSWMCHTITGIWATD